MIFSNCDLAYDFQISKNPGETSGMIREFAVRWMLDYPNWLLLWKREAHESKFDLWEQNPISGISQAYITVQWFNVESINGGKISGVKIAGRGEASWGVERTSYMRDIAMLVRSSRRVK